MILVNQEPLHCLFKSQLLILIRIASLYNNFDVYLIIVENLGKPNSLTQYNLKRSSIQTFRILTAISFFRDMLSYSNLHDFLNKSWWFCNISVSFWISSQTEVMLLNETDKNLLPVYQLLQLIKTNTGCCRNKWFEGKYID